MAALTEEAMKVMVANSRSHDRKYKRKYAVEDYITIQRIEDMACMQNDKCFYCGDDFNYDVVSRTHRDGCTLERVDEKEAHTIENCVLACSHCNCARGPLTYEEMLEKASDIKAGSIKHCSDCKTWFSRDENAFQKNKSHHDGLQNICRSCFSVRGYNRKLKKLERE